MTKIPAFGHLARRQLSKIEEKAISWFKSADESDDPLAAFAAYRVAALQAGVRQTYLFLSFDCDTDLDIKAALEVHRFLSGLNIKMTLAVPGVQLQNGREEYRRLSDVGVEFMNHGYRPHAEWCVEKEKYISATFYSEMSEEEIRADIEAGHRTVVEVTGREPAGFRAPHFGCFQEENQLGLIYQVAENLNYKYCSTTIPRFGLENGPVFRRGSVLEIPTFGSLPAPTTILDSWTYLTDRQNYALGDIYYDLFEETVETFARKKVPAVLSWYVDPAHVAGQKPFEDAMELIARHRIPSLNGRDVVEMWAL